VDPRASLDDVEKRKFLTLPVLISNLLAVVQPVASLYTDYTILAPQKCKELKKKIWHMIMYFSL
jgi:hypothetical protein